MLEFGGVLCLVDCGGPHDPWTLRLAMAPASIRAAGAQETESLLVLALTIPKLGRGPLLQFPTGCNNWWCICWFYCGW